MIRSIYTFSLLLLSLVLTAQTDYWQQEVEYSISAQIDTSTQTITAKCGIRYHNNSPQTLDRIYIHLWANAFSNKSTPFANQALKMGMTDYHFANESELGGYQEIEVSLPSDEGPLELIYEEGQNEIAYIPIEGGLPPGASMPMVFYYTLKVPKHFSRLGKTDNMYNMVAWYPKPAVYDRDGWHTFPYLSMGEFFSEFANYDVTLSAPENYIIAHSGKETERRTDKGYLYIDTRLENAHDFAWFASDKFTIEEEKVKLANGQVVDVKVYRKANDKLWDKAMRHTKQSLTFMADYMGDYPYSTLSIVQGEDGGMGGAMEYPSIKIIKDVKTDDALEYYIAHEIGHSWFYAALGSNERDESYFDEGLTTFLEQKYTAHYYEGTNYHNRNLPSIFYDSEKPLLRLFTEGQICRHMHQPMTTPVTELSTINYGLNAYQIGSTMIAHLESLIGDDKLRDILRSFYVEWKFKHPKYQDLLSHLERESKIDLSGYNDIIAGHPVDASISKVTGGTIRIANKGESNIAIPLLITYEDDSTERENILLTNEDIVLEKNKKIKSAILDPEQTSLDINPQNNIYPSPSIGIRFISLDRSHKKDIHLSPIVGYNFFDGAMVGLSMYNSTFPAKDLKWNITPMFGFKNKDLVGQSWISYDTRPASDKIRKIQYRLGVKSFSISSETELTVPSRYIRIDPSISVHHMHSPASKKYSKTTLRQLWVRTEIFNNSDESTQNITRLTHNRYNFDKLQPKELELELEYNAYSPNSVFESENYLKLSLDYRHGFLFQKNKKFDMRLYAAGFILNSRRENAVFNDLTTPGSISLLSQGFTDYSYDDYFLDRSGQRSERAFRQIGYHGGGFKDALGSANSVGESNDFGMAINLKSHLPFGPSMFPLKLFFDAGYVRTKSFSSNPLEGEIFYSGGVMLDFSDGLFEVYLPLFSSNNISDIYQSNDRNLWSRVTFSIDLHRFNPWDLADDYNF